MEFKDKVKDVLDKAGDVAEKTYKTVADKSSKFMEEAKLKIQASDIEDEITATLGEIGVMVYEKYKSGEKVAPELAKECKRIEKMYKDIDKIDVKTLYLKDLRVCEECKETIGIENKFCPHCGAKQKKVRIPEEKVEEVITEKVCPECKAVHGVDVNFCTKCGYKFEEIKKAK